MNKESAMLRLKRHEKQKIYVYMSSEQKKKKNNTRFEKTVRQRTKAP